MHILVTGGAGFIGSHMVEWLLDQRHTVRVLDNLSTGHADNLGAWSTQIDLRVHDIRDTEAVQSAVAGVDAIIHLAALVSVGQSIAEPELAHAINVTGTLRILEAARAAAVGRVVLASSCAVYGDPTRIPTDEDTRPHPLSPYALSKYVNEQYAQLYNDLYGLECVALRFFNVYGPRQDPKSPYAAAVPRFIAALLAGEQPMIFGDGLQSRDFIYVGDIVRALWTAASTPGIAGAVFNVGGGAARSVLELAQTIGNLLGVRVQPNFAPERIGEVRHSCADIARFAEQAGFRASVDLISGLAATLAPLRMQPLTSK